MGQSVLVWLLIERDGAVLLGRRKDGRPPFAGRWTLPGAVMRDEESAEETVARFALEELGMRVTGEEFVDTLYLTEGGENYVTSIFRVTDYDGGTRFRESGDLAEARWVTLVAAGEAAVFPMPGGLRTWLVGSAGGAPAGTPDNRASWDAVSAAYQAKHQLKTGAAHYGPRMPTEADLRLLGEVRGKRVLEIGCGGGQCSIAFAKEGAFATGIDQSAAQLAFARELAASEGVRVEFLEGDITTLPQIGTASQEAVFSSHALTYVEDVATCFAEVARVLKRGGVFVFSTNHPVEQMMSDEDPLALGRPYWDEYQEWEWGEEGSGVWMRSWGRTIETWFDLLRGAGFVVDRILEPRMLVEAEDETWDEGYPLSQGLMIPTTVIFRAIRP